MYEWGTVAPRVQPLVSLRCWTRGAVRPPEQGSSSASGPEPKAGRGRAACSALGVLERVLAPSQSPSTRWSSTPTELWFDHSDFEKQELELDTLCSNSVVAPPRRPQDAPVDGSQPLPSSAPRLPVYVMLPLDTVWLVEREGRRVSVIKRERALEAGLRTLRQAGVEGVMLDVWWGIVEAAGPRAYDFSAYRRLIEKVAANGLKVQAVMSFHSAGNNVGDTCRIPLPRWVLDVGQGHPDIFYTDKAGTRNRECLGIGCDNAPLFQDRTPIGIYTDFMERFLVEMGEFLGNTITEITLGMGPAGELRYPAYPEGDGRWRFPGVGEFQCYDAFMRADLQAAATAAGRPEWGVDGGPHDCGAYNSHAWETGFFVSQGGNWDTDYGRFFLGWYSGLLLRHADQLLTQASSVVRELQQRQLPGATALMAEEGRPGGACHFSVKLAGVHWWFKSRAHAAELTAGYYNTRERDGYRDIMALLKRHHARASFTCVEMRDCEHPPEARCSPEGLLQQVIAAASAAEVPLSGENALQRYDEYAFGRIIESALGMSARAGRLQQLTFLRMGDLMFDNWAAFSRFLARLREP